MPNRNIKTGVIYTGLELMLDLTTASMTGLTIKWGQAGFGIGKFSDDGSLLIKLVLKVI